MEKLHPYSRVASRGERISCGAFLGSAKILPESKRRTYAGPNNAYVPDDEYNALYSLTVVRYEDVPDINNGDIYEWYELGNDKYGRTMYDVRTGIRRTQTMGEFYETSTVD